MGSLSLKFKLSQLGITTTGIAQCLMLKFTTTKSADSRNSKGNIFAKKNYLLNLYFLIIFTKSIY